MALDARLTDDDVIALLQTAYPETELEDIQGNDKILGQYFTCVHHGRDVIRSHITFPVTRRSPFTPFNLPPNDNSP